MSKRFVTFAVVVGMLVFVWYLDHTGVTFYDAKAWVERQLGVRAQNPDMNSVPYTNYGPIVAPGK